MSDTPTRPKTIIRATTDERCRTKYVTVASTAIRDPRLSMKAKGILVTALDAADGFAVTIGWLCTRCRDGRESIMAGLRELVDAGYARYADQHDAAGKFQRGGWIIAELPQSGFPTTAEPQSANPQSANPQSANPQSGNPTLMKTIPHEHQLNEDQERRERAPTLAAAAPADLISEREAAPEKTVAELYGVLRSGVYPGRPYRPTARDEEHARTLVSAAEGSIDEASDAVRRYLLSDQPGLVKRRHPMAILATQAADWLQGDASPARIPTSKRLGPSPADIEARNRRIRDENEEAMMLKGRERRARLLAAQTAAERGDRHA